MSFFSYYFSEYLLIGKDFQRITIITPSNINSDSLISANIHSCLIFIHLFFKSQFIIGFFKSELKHCIWLEYLLFLPHFLKIIPPSFYFLKCCLFVEETVNSARCFIYLFLAVLVFVAAQTCLTGEWRQRSRRGAWLPVVMASLVEQTLGRQGFSSCSGRAR